MEPLKFSHQDFGKQMQEKLAEPKEIERELDIRYVVDKHDKPADEADICDIVNCDGIVKANKYKDGKLIHE